MSNDLDAAAESLLQAAETITTLRKQLEQVTAELDALHSMAEHYKDCINKQLEKIRDQEFAISELSRLLEEEKKLSAAISRDCNVTALERNELRGKFEKLSAKYAELGPLAQKLMAERDAYKKDAERMFFAFEADGFGSVPMDKHDYAMQVAEERGHEEPTHEDEIEGLRRLIDSAMEK